MSPNEAAKACEKCGHEAQSDVFIGRKGAVYPWCADCRQADPVGARKAYDRMCFSWKYQHMSTEEREALRARLETKKQSWRS